MEYVIHPYQGVGAIQLGMTAEQVRLTIGTPYDSLLRSEFAKMPMDFFDSDGISIEYDKTWQCEAIEIWPPSQALLFDTPLIGQSIQKLKKLLLELDPLLVDEDCGVTSYQYGVGLYAEGFLKDLNAEVESVIIFRKGYYDQAD